MATEADSEPSLSTKRLEGKVAVVTGGAATGIGRAAVRMFAAHGAFVLFGDIQDKLDAELALELAPRATFLHCDVTQEKDVAALVDAAVDTYGRLDIMYNNAGIAGLRSLSVQELDMAFMDFVYNVNIRGAILGTKHAARVMIPAKSGVILATASTASMLMDVEPVPHNISRLAMAGLIRSASAELGPHGIRVNCISSSTTVWTPSPSPSADYQKLCPEEMNSTGRSVPRRPALQRAPVAVYCCCRRTSRGRRCSSPATTRATSRASSFLWTATSCFAICTAHMNRRCQLAASSRLG